MKEKETFSVEQCAKYIGVSSSTLYIWMKKGLITFYELPPKHGFKRFVRFRKADVDAFLEKHKKEAA